jgi:hypothetical protein
MVRGSALRVTGLDRRGSIPHPINFAVSKSVAKVTVNESTEAGSNELLGSEENDNDNRLHFVRPDQVINYSIDIDFLRVDPGVLSLVAGVPLITQRGDLLGFGEAPFGSSPFGGVLPEDGENPVVGFDSETRRPAASFGMEVWSKLAGTACIDGVREYGYTVFPYLKGGYISGFEFKNGLVSFNLRRAQARKVPRWGVGPYDLEGPHERLVEVVSRNTLFRTALTTGLPPAEVAGIQETEDVIYGGSASVTSADVIDGGDAADTSPWIIYGGQAV